jgi:glycosyltransferase involved in cell wall biosynthesis
MRVAIDTRALRSGHKVRGIGVMVGEQVKALKKEAIKHNNVIIQGVDFDGTDLSSYDIVHFPYFFPYFATLPDITPPSKVIVTIQDLIYLVFPERYPPGLSGKRIFKTQKKKINKVDGIVTISKTSKKDIHKYLNIQKNIVDVVYLAPKEIFKPITDKNKLAKTKKKFKLPDTFVLYVGDVNYNKNIVTLVKACENINANLVIVGKQATEVEEMGLKLDTIRGPMDWIRYVLNIPHPELQHFRALNEELRNYDNIVRTGFVSESELVDIYNLATVYCQPSVYEGFGFPVLESMSCDTPVIASNIEAHMEVAGKAVDYFEPENENDLSNKLKLLLNSSKNRLELVKKGKERVKKYSWDKYAKEMIGVYKKVNNK